jgi:hypothetical protein
MHHLKGLVLIYGHFLSDFAYARNLETKQRALKTSVEYKAISTRIIIESIPQFFNLKYTWFTRVITEFSIYHRYLTVFLHTSQEYTRTFRLCVLTCHILYPTFLMTLFYVYTNPDDGLCEPFVSERTCLFGNVIGSTISGE